MASCSEPSAEDDVVRSLDIELNLDDSGDMAVTETYEWDFGEREGLGFYREIVTELPVPGEWDMQRQYQISDVEITSPSGAPAELDQDAENGALQLIIGAPEGSEDTVTGVQTYELSYEVHGAVNQVRDARDAGSAILESGEASWDEVYWNVTGDRWDVPLQDVTTRVTGPAQVLESRCFEGEADDDGACAAEEDGGSVGSFHSNNLEPEEQQTVAVAFPAGTFEQPEKFVVRQDGWWQSLMTSVARVTDPAWNQLRSQWRWWVLGGLAIFAVGTGVRVLRGRDDQFTGVPAGHIPDQMTVPADSDWPSAQSQAAHSTASRRVGQDPPVSPRSEPPAGLSPAEVGLLRRKRPNEEDLSLTLLDLAARGYLQLTHTTAAAQSQAWRQAQVQSQPPELTAQGLGVGIDDLEHLEDRDDGEEIWIAERNPQADLIQLKCFERRIFDAVFAEGRQRRDLATLEEDFRKAFAEAKKDLQREANARELFRRPFQVESAPSLKGWLMFPLLMIGILLALFGAVNFANYMFSDNHMVPPSVAMLGGVWAGLLILWGICWLGSIGASRPRTAVGRALYDQSRGHEMYLKQIAAHHHTPAEHAPQEVLVMSRHLPYAMALGIQDEWTGYLEDLARGFPDQAQPDWICDASGSHTGHTYPYVLWSRIGGSLGGFSHPHSRSRWRLGHRCRWWCCRWWRRRRGRRPLTTARRLAQQLPGMSGMKVGQPRLAHVQLDPGRLHLEDGKPCRRVAAGHLQHGPLSGLHRRQLHTEILDPWHMSDHQQGLDSLRSLVDHCKHLPSRRQVEAIIQVRGGSLLPQLVIHPGASLASAHGIRADHRIGQGILVGQQRTDLTRLLLSARGERAPVIFAGEGMPGLCMAEDQQGLLHQAYFLLVTDSARGDVLINRFTPSAQGSAGPVAHPRSVCGSISLAQRRSLPPHVLPRNWWPRYGEPPSAVGTRCPEHAGPSQS